MSGSRAWFNYESDNGITYAVELDEDLGLLVNAGFTPYTDGTPTTTLPQGYRMRYVNAVKVSGDGAGFVSRQFAMGTTEASIYSGDVSTFTYDGETYAVSSARGEKQRRPKQLNTGLTQSGGIVG